MHIIGTAGHVDHGKSSLVAALTGTNPDRWAEEQLRGMTLDLGFARLLLDDGLEAGIVDVPGHERFLHNMLAGAAGMELLLLVVAATEGVMPQTREHLEILRFLNVRETIVAVTKIDVLTEGTDEASDRIRRELAGTIAQDAPFFPVSTRTGANLAALREGIHRALARLPARDLDAPAYLPIDRVFALPGLGTIVTGTLMQGRIALGETLTLQPSGISVRVRSLQTFGERRDRVEGGARVAVNVPSVGANEIARGEMLVAPQFAASAAFDVRFTALAHAIPLLRRRTAVRAYVGSAEILGTLVLDAVPAGETPVRARLLLRRQTVAYPGTAFVLRRLSPKTVLGGGVVESAGGSGDTSEAGDAASPAQAALLAVFEGEGLSALDAPAAAQRANLREDVADAAFAALQERGEILSLAKPPAFVSMRAAQTLLRAALEVLESLHRSEPWAMGATSLALARAMGVDEALVLRVLGAFARDGRIAHRAGYFAAPDHVPKLNQAQQEFFASQLRAADADAPVPLAEMVSAVRQSPLPGIRKSFDTLVARGALIKVGEDLYRGEQIERIRARLEQFLRSNQRITMAQFRDLIGTSRKYSVPLLEWFDARGITVRSGDYRMLRSTRPAGSPAALP